MDPRAGVLLMLLLCAALCSAVPQDCCLDVANRRLPVKVVESYRLQEEGRGCDISATVVTLKGKETRQVCLPHPREQSWVARLLKMVDQRQQQ